MEPGGTHGGESRHADRPSDRRPQRHESVFGGHSRGDMRFMIIGKGSVYADVFIEFLKRLISGAGRKIFLIVDRGPAHRAKKAGAFVQTLARKLRLFLL